MSSTPKPLVTVIIPTFNRAALLEQALEGVFAQTYRDFKVLVADNASTDETPDVVAAFDDPCLTYVRRPTNVGLIANWAASVETVQTPYAIVVGDDDIPYPALLEEALATLESNENVGMVHSAFDLIDAQGEIVERSSSHMMGLQKDTIETGQRFIEESMRWWCRVCPTTALFRMRALPKPPFNPLDYPGIDFGLWLRIAAAWDVAYIARPLAAYRVHDRSATSDQARPGGGGYRITALWVADEKNVKLRFLEEQGHRLRRVRTLRRLASKAARQQIVYLASVDVAPDRRVAMLRALFAAARRDPTIVTHTDAWKLTVAALLGPRLVERVRRLRYR